MTVNCFILLGRPRLKRRSPQRWLWIPKTRLTHQTFGFHRQLVAAVALFWATAASATLSIHGRVVTADGQGLSHASVELCAIKSGGGAEVPALEGATGVANLEPVATTRSDPQGYFRLIAPTDGMWQVLVRAEGHVPVAYSLLPLLENTDLPTAFPRVGTTGSPRSKAEYGAWVEAVAPEPTRAVGDDLKDQAGIVPIHGRVVDSASQKGIAGAYVWPRHDASAFTRTDARGRYTLAVTDASQAAHFQAAAAGYLPRRGMAEPAETSSNGLTLALQPAARISGRVVDAAGRPVAKAEIYSSQTMARTDLRGRFRLTPLGAARPVEITFTKEGFIPGTEILPRLKPGETRTNLEVVLRQGRAVLGQVVDEQGTPVPGAEAALIGLSPMDLERDLLFTSREQQGPLVAITDTAGVFLLGNVPLGSHQLTVERAGFAPMTVRALDIPQGQGNLELETIVLKPGATVSGIVTDLRGAALADATVYSARSSVRPFPGPFVNTAATSAADGNFSVQDLSPGTKIDLQVRRSGYRSVTVLAVTAPTSDPIEIVMEPASEVSGQVVDTRGEPIEAARVSIRSEEPSQSMPPTFAPAHSDHEGSFSLTEVDPGRSILSASADGYLPSEPIVVEIPAGDAISDLEIVLKKGEATIQGQILGPGNQPKGSVRVSNSGVSVLTDGNGFYLLSGVATGHQTVTAVSSAGLSQLSRSLEVEPGVNTLDLLFEGYPVSGHVLDPTDAPIAGASVRLQGTTEGAGSSFALSSADGSFDLTEVADGRYRVFAAKEGFADGDAAREITIDGAPVNGIEIRLDTGSTLSGRLLGLEAERLAQVRVSAKTRVNQVMGIVTPDGEYRIAHLAPGDWRITARLEGDIVEEQIRLEHGIPETILDLEFGLGLTLTGQVLSDNEPLTGARVSLLGIDRPEPRFALTDYRGEFSFGDLDSGTYQVGVAGHLEGVDVFGDQDVLIEISTADISGRVLDASTSLPVSGATLSLGPAPGTGGSPNIAADITTDFEGRFVWSGVTEGSYQLVARKEGYAPSEEAVEVGAGLQSLEISMTPTQGLVLQLASSPYALPSQVYAAVLDATGRGLSFERATPDAGGWVRLSTVPPGNWELLVAAPGKATARVAIQVPTQEDAGENPSAVVPVALPQEGWLELVVPELDASNVAAILTLTSPEGKPWQTLNWGILQQEWQLYSGRVSVAGLPSGTWSVAVSAADGRVWDSLVNTLSGAVARVTVD